MTSLLICKMEFLNSPVSSEVAVSATSRVVNEGALLRMGYHKVVCYFLLLFMAILKSLFCYFIVIWSFSLLSYYWNISLEANRD